MKKNDKNGTALILYTLATLAMLVLVVFGLFAGNFVDESVALRALENQGFEQVRILNKDIFFVSLRGCDKSDAAKFDAVAVNPAGKEVQVYVCSGWLLKGATVRSK